MINGMTPEQYATAVARLCDSCISFRAFVDYDALPITQMVDCNNQWHTYEKDSIKSLGLQFMRDWGNGVFIGSGSPIFRVAIENELDVYTPIYETVLYHIKSIWNKLSDNTIVADIRKYPVLMFITTIACDNEAMWEFIKSQYQAAIFKKYGIVIPDILIRQSAPGPQADFTPRILFTNTGSEDCRGVSPRILRRM